MSRFLQHWRTYVEKITDTPSEFIEASGLACLSGIAMGRRWISRGSEIRPNLFVMLVAGSTNDRKSFGVEKAKQMLHDVDPERVGPDDFTVESLCGLMAVPKKPDLPSRNVQWIGIEEFGTYLAQTSSYNATASAALCKLYDGSSFSRIRQGTGFQLIEKPRLTIFAACAFGMFERYCDPKDWNTGFYARFLFVPPMTRRPTQDMQPGASIYDEEICRAYLTDLKNEIAAYPGAMAILPEAEDLFRSFAASFRLMELSDITDPAIQASHARLMITTIKLALLYQIDLNPGQPIGPIAMERACAFTKVGWFGFKYAYGGAAGDDFSRIMRRALDAISAAGPSGIQRSILMRRFHLEAKQMENIIKAMLANQLVTIREEPVPGGRGRGSKRQFFVATEAEKPNPNSVSS
jgi:hypothetical protein